MNMNERTNIDFDKYINLLQEYDESNDYSKLPLITVIIPVYNVEKYLRECLDSIVKQVYPNLEVIVVDDKSMDYSHVIIDEFVSQYSYVKKITHNVNNGLSAARNTGMDHATGEYIVFVDSDDCVSSRYVFDMYYCMVTYNSDFVMCNIEGMDEKSCSIHDDYTPIRNRKYINSKMTKLEELDGNPIYCIDLSEKRILIYFWPSAWNKMYRRDIIKKNQLRYPVGLYYEDHPFYSQYFNFSRSVHFIEAKHYKYRTERENKIMLKTSPKIFDTYKILDLLKDIYYKSAEKILADEMYLKMTTQLIAERLWAMDRKDPIRKEFLKAGKTYLSDYSFKEALRAKFETVTTEFLTEMFSYVPLRKNRAPFKYKFKQVLKHILYPVYNRFKKLKNAKR